MDSILGAIMAALLLVFLADLGLDAIMWVLGISAWILILLMDDPTPPSDDDSNSE